MSFSYQFLFQKSYFFLKVYHYTLKISNYLDGGESKNNDNVYKDNVEGIFTYVMPTECKFFTDEECLLLSLTKGNQSLRFF